MTSTMRRVARHLPEPAKAALRRAVGDPRLRRATRRVRWGTLRRLEPVSPAWGSERGRLVDRYYIERFFASHAELIRGRVLEVRDAQYSTAHGRGVTSVEIVDVDPRNDDATILADLSDRGSLPEAAFDCVVVPQTLVYVADPFAAMENLWRSVARGGALLVTSPAIARLDPVYTADDRWHLTPAGLETLIARCCPDADYAVEAYGNPVTAIAFLQGIAVEELRPEELDAQHPLFPIVVMAAVRKAS